MATGPPDPPEDPTDEAPAKAGALIVRVWLEESGDPKLRIRMVGRLDLEADDHVTAAAADIDEMLVHIRGWLERFADPGQGLRQRHTQAGSEVLRRKHAEFSSR